MLNVFMLSVTVKFNMLNLIIAHNDYLSYAEYHYADWNYSECNSRLTLKYLTRVE